MKFIKIVSRIIIVVLTPILACIGCTSGGNDVGGDEYGVPYSDLDLYGIAQQTDGTPIAGIEVSPEYNDGVVGTSDAEGQWHYDYAMDSFPDDNQLLVRAIDVDGEQNGGCFADSEQQVTLTQTDPGDGNWDEGDWEATDIVFEMEEIECPDAGVDDDGGIKKN